MLRELNAATARHSFGEMATSGLNAGRPEEFRLERLLELRAVIDVLRAEYRPQPPYEGQTRGRNTSQ